MARYVVAGATGRVGGVVVAMLLGRGHEVIAITRDRDRADGLRAQGVLAAHGPLDDRELLTGALRRADGFFALLPEDPFAPDFHGPRHRMTEAMTEAVKASGVARVVLLSAIAASLAEGNGPARGLHELEAALGTTGTVLTTLRACWLQENVGAAMGPASGAGIYPNFFPSADVPFPTIASADVGGFAAEALTGPAVSETVDLLGPAYSARQMARVLGSALGKPLRIVDIPAPAHAATLTQAGLSPAFAEAVAELYACFASGRVRPRGDRQLAGTTTLETTVGRMVSASR